MAPEKLLQPGNTSLTTQVSLLVRILPDVASRVIQAKKLSDWMKSNSCKKRGINKDTVAEIVKQALRIEGEADA